MFSRFYSIQSSENWRNPRLSKIVILDMLGQIATKQEFVIFFQASIMTQATLTHIELGHVT